MRFRRARALGSRPSVSVVIPCYNYGRYLPAAVSSVLQDEGVQVDILIVDDASTDGSAEVAQSLAATYPEVDVLVHEQNRGHIATYNDGLVRARGDYVVLLSADDQLTPGSLSRATALLEAHPEVAWVYGAVCRVRPGSPRRVDTNRRVGLVDGRRVAEESLLEWPQPHRQSRDRGQASRARRHRRLRPLTPPRCGHVALHADGCTRPRRTNPRCASGLLPSPRRQHALHSVRQPRAGLPSRARRLPRLLRRASGVESSARRVVRACTTRHGS